MATEETIHLDVEFGEWAWAQLPGGRAEAPADPYKPIQAVVAEAVEALVREQLEGGKNREVRVEPTSFSGNAFAGTITVADPDGGYERAGYLARRTFAPRPSSDDADA